MLSYGTLDGIFEHLPEIKESVRKKLERDREQAYQMCIRDRQQRAHRG